MQPQGAVEAHQGTQPRNEGAFRQWLERSMKNPSSPPPAPPMSDAPTPRPRPRRRHRPSRHRLLGALPCRCRARREGLAVQWTRDHPASTAMTVTYTPAGKKALSKDIVFNILFSNTEVMLPNIYANPPKPVVRCRFVKTLRTRRPPMPSPLGGMGMGAPPPEPPPHCPPAVEQRPPPPPPGRW